MTRMFLSDQGHVRVYVHSFTSAYNLQVDDKNIFYQIKEGKIVIISDLVVCFVVGRFKTKTHTVTQTALELMNLPPQVPDC